MKILTVLFTLTISTVFAQKNMLNILNSDFELGTTQLWRAVEVSGNPQQLLYVEADNTFSSVVVSEDANNGNFSGAFTWGVDATMVDLLFDQSPMVIANTNYTYKAWAKSLDGSCILRIHCTYFNANNVVIADHVDQSWVLTDTYQEHIWEVPPAPTGVLYAIIGFRVFKTNGSRWPDSAITTLIDDVSMWRETLASDIPEYALTTNYSGVGTGTVTYDPTGGIYCEGTEVLVTVIPEGGSDFVGWSGDASGAEETTSIIMDGDKTIIAEIDGTASVENEVLEKSIILSPNPVIDFLAITSKVNLTKVEIYSILGVKVKEVTSNFNSISLTNLPNGNLYILVIQSEDGKAIKKIIKQ